MAYETLFEVGRYAGVERTVSAFEDIEEPGVHIDMKAKSFSGGQDRTRTCNHSDVNRVLRH